LYVLLRLDVARAGASYEHKIITVEHVLPQSPAPGSHWMTNFSPDEREYWLHRLADLVPLDRRKNSAAANLGFDEKKSATSPLRARCPRSL
jgi:hypothetical protein